MDPSGGDSKSSEADAAHATTIGDTTADPPGAKRGRLGAELTPGEMIGEYRVEEKLGEGGMGRVYAAVHPVIGKRAAIKVLRHELSASADATERFVIEARAVNAISHPNIVDIFAFGELLDGRGYFVMERLEGESLADRIARGPLTLGEICRIGRDIARALDAAHAKGVIHRDLKPDNVFLVDVHGQARRVKLLDFGIAKLTGPADNRMERTRTGSMIGTPSYIAPEQARGFQVDARVDIYSLGVMLFELLCGRRPFVGESAMDVVASHLHDPPPRVSSLRPGVAPTLDDLVDRMLAKDAAARPSIEDVIGVLDEVEHLPEVASPPPRVRRVGPVIALVVAAIGIGVVAFVVVRALGGENHGDNTASRYPLTPSDPPAAVVVVDATAPKEPAVATEPAAAIDAAVAIDAAAAPTHARRAPTTGTVIVRAPRGLAVRISIDGVAHQGTEPIALPPGLHRIRFSARGYRPYVANVRVRAGQTHAIRYRAVAVAPARHAGPKVDNQLMDPRSKRGR